MSLRSHRDKGSSRTSVEGPSIAQRQKKEKKAHVEAKKNAELQEKLQQALTHSATTAPGVSKAVRQHLLASGVDTSKAHEEIDSYGHGCPTDRLQFGYAPSVVEEAVLFHSAVGAKQWIADRKRNGRVAFVTKQKLRNPNCEPLTTILKLKRYWSHVQAFGESLRSDPAGGAGMTTEAAEAFLDILAKQQGLADDEESNEVVPKPLSSTSGSNGRGSNGQPLNRGIDSHGSSRKSDKKQRGDTGKSNSEAGDCANSTVQEEEKDAKRRRLELL
mmetsp:Transcript_8935/g.10070  ORF Transcript_8935/g.10070 Transcript_8935/m.10070 type:complete len:273 (+) Transcript_8935:49-867(+)|eukprot:CAMPEP_0176420746 /NCGR_PEP_ID=MMETSP0127-20121128/8778_1 /TAXON_ID=938130 /ORGANISM="Platyophrya macrostoma, Strain WH" /LENGTH=272 /DNA_ID=CAMNT_0017801377 /DNA_START=45 /DNA_END=863 /DNA_ORIENTATION=-